MIHKKQGMGLVEILIGVAIIVIGILALTNSYAVYIKYAFANQSNTQAAYISEEGLEAVTFLRDKSWSTYISPLSAGTTYYLAFSTTYWAATTTAQAYIDGQFLRTIAVANVYRDANYNIASSGTLDPNTKQITVTVSYLQGHATTTQSMSTYITNLYNN